MENNNNTVDMEDFKDIKKMWTDMNRRVSTLEEENKKLAWQISKNNYENSQEKLVKKYSIFILIEILALLAMEIQILKNPIVVEKYRLVNIIYWGVFFGGEIIIDFILMLKVKSIDIYNSSVAEIAEKSLQNWKLHKLAVCIGLPVAIGGIILFALLLNVDYYAICGMIVGGIIGLIIGITQLFKFAGYYKQLRSE